MDLPRLAEVSGDQPPLVAIPSSFPRVSAFEWAPFGILAKCRDVISLDPESRAGEKLHAALKASWQRICQPVPYMFDEKFKSDPFPKKRCRDADYCICEKGDQALGKYHDNFDFTIRRLCPANSPERITLSQSEMFFLLIGESLGEDGESDGAAAAGSGAEAGVAKEVPKPVYIWYHLGFPILSPFTYTVMLMEPQHANIEAEQLRDNCWSTLDIFHLTCKFRSMTSWDALAPLDRINTKWSIVFFRAVFTTERVGRFLPNGCDVMRTHEGEGKVIWNPRAEPQPKKPKEAKVELSGWGAVMLLAKSDGVEPSESKPKPHDDGDEPLVFEPEEGGGDAGSQPDEGMKSNDGDGVASSSDEDPLAGLLKLLPDYDHNDGSPGTPTSQIQYENSGDEDVAMEPAVNAQPIIEDDPIDFPPFDFCSFSEDARSLRWDFSVGRLIYTKRSRELAAICNDSRHTEFAECKKRRFCKPYKDTDQGRPLGHLLAWLLLGPRSLDNEGHKHAAWPPLRPQRLNARRYFETLPGSEKLPERAQKNDYDYEPDST